MGLIGCCRRETDKAAQAIIANHDVIITAIGNIFQDRLEEVYKAIVEVGGEKVKVNGQNKFVGFDAYLKVIESGVDVVLLATPPAFRSLHLTAANMFFVKSR